MQVKLLLYLSLFLSTLPLFTIKAENGFFFSHLGVEDGLSQISVLKVFQDSDGYLWFGTRNGLNRYNGYDFKIYRNEIDNPNSLSDRYIKDIDEDKNKNMWIATQNGLNCIEYHTGNIRRFYPAEIEPSCTSNNISHVIPHSNGNLYMLAGSNVFICQPDGLSVSFLKKLNIPYAIRSIIQDLVREDIYIGTDNGLYIYSSDWELIKYILPDKNNALNNYITSILPDENEIWLGTENAGIYLYDFLSEEFIHFDKHNTNLGNSTVRSMIFLNRDSILIGTFGGLNILDKKELAVNTVQMNMQGQGSISHYSVHSMLIDKEQTLWIGTYSAGVNIYSPYYKQISYITTQAYTGINGKGAQDKAGNLWFATEGSGLLFHNPRTQEQKLYPLKPLSETNYERNIIKYILYRERSDEILCTTHFGSVYSFSIPYKTSKLLYDYKENDIYCLYIDRKQRLWIPTMTATAHTVVIENGKEKNTFLVNGKEEHLEQITVIHEITGDVFLLGGFNNSLSLYDLGKGIKQDLIRRLPESIQKEKLGIVTSICHDSSHVWVSTTKSGILKFDHTLRFIRQYLTTDGLSDTHVSTMVIDHNRDIWAATVNEISKYNKQIDQFIPVKHTDVPKQEFSVHAGTVSGDGTIYFPASRGILSFNPDKLRNNPAIPPLYITSLIINNNEDILNQAKPISRDDPKKLKITLKSEQNSLTLSYAALNYIHPAGNQYMYRMDGTEDDWHNVGNRREAYYSNLHPGSYTFRVKASNNDGLWNPEEATLQIRILPPVYKTWWAYTLYILIILILSFQIYRYQHRRSELEREVRFREKEQERMKELHEERLRMFNNFSHELRTPLTLIINPLEDLLQSISFSRDVKQALGRMKKNTQRMLMLVNNLMDVQKYEAGQSKLQKKQFKISAFVREIYQSFAGIAEKRRINFTLQNELPENYLACYDETEIEKVFFNLLSNAFKFTPAEGHVTLLIRQAIPTDHPNAGDKAYVYIEVKDDGKGFSREEGEKIFEPFYRFKDDIHQQISGTGIGLNLARSIVTLHHGFIWAKSSEETGTRFIVILPDTETQRKEMYVQSYTLSSETNRKTKLLLDEVDTHKKQTILIADDDAEIRDYLKQQLENDYKVIIALNGKEALQLITASPPNLIVSDVVMPGMNGMQLCRQIKNTPELSHIPVVLLTGKSSASQIEEGLYTGADDYITKPFHISILKAKIHNLLAYRKKNTPQDVSAGILQTFGINPDTAKDSFLVQYIEIVKENISNPELDITLIYEKLGMSRANFYRKVKNLTGLSPVDLIRNIRLETGVRLLCDTDLNISEIAQRTGFGSRSYFTRNFKSAYGISPSEYQEKNKRVK